MAGNVFARAVTFDTPAATGSFDVTGELNDMTPKAVIFIANSHSPATTEGSEFTGVIQMIGMTDGTRQHAMNIRLQDNQATSAGSRLMQNNVCIWMNRDSSNLVQVQANITGFIPNGVTLNFQTANVQVNMTAIFFFGSDLSAYSNRVALGNVASTVTVNSVGFQGDIGIFAHAQVVSDTTDAVSSDACFGIGFAPRTGGTQANVIWVEDTAVASGGQPAAQVVTGSAITGLNVATGASSFTGTVGNWTSAGFDVVVNAASGNTDAMYLILKVGTLSVTSFTHSSPTATGVQSVTTPGFFPQLVFTVGTNAEAVNTVAFDSQLSGAYNMSVFDAANEYSHVMRDSSVADPSDYACTFNQVALQSGTGLNLTGVIATAAFTASGWDYTFTDVESTAKVFLSFALQLGDILPSPVGFTFGDFTDESFVDWSIDGAEGENFNSYLRTFFHAAEDEMYWMQAPYIYIFLENEDPNTASTSADEDSLFVRGAWDWSNSASSLHWSRSQQVYKYRQNNLVAVSRTKMRGRGRVLQLRFDSEEGKNFKLYGWSMPLGKNSDP